MLDSHTVPVCPELDQGSHRSIPRLAYNIEAARISAGVSRTRIFQAIKNRELIARNGRLPRDADDIVDGWLARGWRPEIIRNVVCTLMRYQRPSINSLNYFEEPIAKAHEA
jgi:hypothetical protein